MFRLNLKIAFRNLFKHRIYTLINVLGLSIGMASCILIFIFIHYQLSFDKGFANGDRIYRFVTDWKYNSFVDYSAGSPIPFAPAARIEIPELDKIARVSSNGGVIIVKDAAGKQTFKAAERVFFAEPEAFQIFSLKWLAGNPNKEFAAPNTAVLSEKMAILFFGSSQNAIGKTFTFWNAIQVKVIGIFENMPVSTSVPLSIVMSFPTTYQKDDLHWDDVSSQNQCFATLKKGCSVTGLQQSLDHLNRKYLRNNKIAGNQTSALQPLADIHFSEHYKNFADTAITKSEIYGLGIIGLFILITACINFINLVTAQSVNRSKEVGIRKVMGSARKQLVIQFLTETFTIALLSLMLACVLSELALPAMQNLFKDEVVFNLFEHREIWLFMAGLVIFVGCFAGAYPALVMSAFSPVLAIKSKITVNSGSLGLRKVLVIVQFAITVVLMISTLMIIQQMKYVRNQSLGFTSNAIAMVSMPGDSLSKSKQDIFRERLLRIPGVNEVSYCVRAPLSGDMNTTSFKFDGRENKDFEVRLSPADERYFNLFDLKVLAGKVYAKADTFNGYVVNEKFVKRVGILNPAIAVGKVIDQNGNKGPIVAVVKDFHDLSLKSGISPMILYRSKRHFSNAAIRLDQHQIVAAMPQIEALWNSFFPEEVYNASFIDDNIASYYESEHITGLLFQVFAGVIIFISFIGLFGLISFVATQRTKEIAIRKVLGASTIELVRMLNGTFITLVFIANLVAWPIAYIMMSRWLSGFAYRMDLSIWPFVFAMGLSMIITLLTVSMRSYKAATANTISALKEE